jgi:hypothetical protein
VERSLLEKMKLIIIPIIKKQLLVVLNVMVKVILFAMCAEVEVHALLI